MRMRVGSVRLSVTSWHTVYDLIKHAIFHTVGRDVRLPMEGSSNLVHLVLVAFSHCFPYRPSHSCAACSYLIGKKENHRILQCAE